MSPCPECGEGEIIHVQVGVCKRCNCFFRVQEVPILPLTNESRYETITAPYKIMTAKLDDDGWMGGDGDHGHDDRIL